MLTLEEAVKVLNEHRYDDNDAWEIAARGVLCGNLCECCIGFGDAITIALILERSKGSS